MQLLASSLLLFYSSPPPPDGSQPLTLVTLSLSLCPARAQNNKVVILLTGRYAGKKAVIVRNYDDGTNSRPYGHALVVGLAKYPRKVTKRSSEKTREKRMKMKTFVKLVNYNHLMPTRYSLDVDLKASITPDVVENATKRKGASIEARKVFEEKFKTGKSKWFFSKLRF